MESTRTFGPLYLERLPKDNMAEDGESRNPDVDLDTHSRPCLAFRRQRLRAT